MNIKRILVPVDFSGNSLRALEYAIDLARPFKSELTVLNVVEPIYYATPEFTGGGAAITQLVEEQSRVSREQLRRLAQKFGKRRIKLRALIQTGSPHQVIVDTARKIRADLIVMSTHGRTGVSHLLLGSVAERVVRAATCPVLTLRAGQPRRQRARRA